MMLAAVDAKTYGLYENFAVDWQNGPGCKVDNIHIANVVNAPDNGIIS